MNQPSRNLDRPERLAANTRPLRVEILFFDGCPHHDGLADHIGTLLASHHLPAEITERRIDTDAAAQGSAFLGSPTIRVNGADIDPTATTRHEYGLQCRVYPTPEGLRGVPPDDWILNAAYRVDMNRQTTIVQKSP